MKRILTLGAALLFVSAFAFADTYSGKLVDASCAQQQKGAVCNPTGATVAFAIQSPSGTMLRLDATGNKKAADALKGSSNSADRAKDPTAADAGVMATVQGTLSGDEIKVESIEVH